MSVSPSLLRVARVLDMVERTRSAELAQATGSVLEAQRAGADQRNAAAAFRVESQRALAAGEAGSQRLNAALMQAAETRAGQALELEQVREDARQDSLAAYRMSRLQLEQVTTTLDRVREEAAVTRARSQQAETDDGYLARRRWLGARKVNPHPSLMKPD